MAICCEIRMPTGTVVVLPLLLSHEIVLWNCTWHANVQECFWILWGAASMMQRQVPTQNCRLTLLACWNLIFFFLNRNLRSIWLWGYKGKILSFWFKDDLNIVFQTESVWVGNKTVYGQVSVGDIQSMYNRCLYSYTYQDLYLMCSCILPFSRERHIEYGGFDKDIWPEHPPPTLEIH